MGNLPAINWLAAFLPSTVLPLIWECFPRYIRKSLAIHKNDARHWRCLWTLGWWSLWRHNRAKLYLDIYIFGWSTYSQTYQNEDTANIYIYIYVNNYIFHTGYTIYMLFINTMNICSHVCLQYCRYVYAFMYTWYVNYPCSILALRIVNMTWSFLSSSISNSRLSCDP